MSINHHNENEQNHPAKRTLRADGQLCPTRHRLFPPQRYRMADRSAFDRWLHTTWLYIVACFSESSPDLLNSFARQRK